MHLRTRIVTLTVGIGLIPMMIIGIIGFLVARVELQQFIRDRLRGVNITKKTHILEHYSTIQTAVQNISTSDLLKKHAPALVSDTTGTTVASLAAKNAIESELQLVQKLRNFDDIKILNPKGIITYVTNSKYTNNIGTTGNPSVRSSFQRGVVGINFSEPVDDLGDEDGIAEMLVSAPIKNTQGSVVGVVVAEAELSDILDIVMDTTGLSRTGETVLVYRENHSAVLISSLKYEPNAELTKRISFGDAQGFGLQQAAKGESGSGIAVDYRGVKVMAQWDSIPELGWGIETKIDYTEAMSPLDRVFLYGRWGVLASLVFIYILSEYFVGYYVATRVKKLRHATQQMADGKPITIDPRLMQEHDELGELATALHNLSRTEKHGTSATADIPSEAPKHHH